MPVTVEEKTEAVTELVRDEVVAYRVADSVPGLGGDLCVIADHPHCTTTQLAHHARISLASASEHATILRNAGLTALTRHHKTVLHTTTLPGLTLLDTATTT
ncbi:hypothetical protein ACH4SP_04885 [Streptomyces sp. NPDC021093]|uniref:hypothetical protein n=1 Tax=Streptomyces sp. NPDC021093 TaxID=3365112 RepID=UPI00378D935D